MHIIAVLKKRWLGSAIANEAATGVPPSIPVSKKPTSKEMREGEIRAGKEQTIKLLLPLKMKLLLPLN